MCLTGSDKPSWQTPQLQSACCWARCEDPQDLATLRVTHTVPADLNSFLYAMERDLAAFAAVCRLLLLRPLRVIYPASQGLRQVCSTAMSFGHVHPRLGGVSHKLYHVKVPVQDMTSFLACVQLLGDTSAAARFTSAAEERRAAIQALMYDEGRGTHHRAARRHSPPARMHTQALTFGYLGLTRW